MLFALSLLIPLFLVAVVIFWRLSPLHDKPARVRWFNLVAVVIGLLLCGLVAWLIRAYLAGHTDSGKWPGVTGYYVGTLFPLYLAAAGGIRHLLFGGPSTPLELTPQDLSKTRF
ncbi:MAG: hypothetical protein LBE33_10930 [Zoogloeaceae bacterium]|jgi:hypothetical protein|nr:hypothetical protein [Zoogloeaceae bacterium]